MRLRSLLAVPLALLVLAAGACTRDDDESSSSPSPSTSTTTPPPLTFAIAGVEDNGTAAPGPEVVTGVQQALDAYLAQAVVAPLRSGQPAGDLAGVFSAEAAGRIAADPAARQTLVDEGMPAASSVVAERAGAVLGSVAGPDGVPVLVGARIDLQLRATGPGLDVDIVRTGELVLTPEADGWRIDSFVVHTERNTRDA